VDGAGGVVTGAGRAHAAATTSASLAYAFIQAG
jgi:hypothetical protein